MILRIQFIDISWWVLLEWNQDIVTCRLIYKMMKCIVFNVGLLDITTTPWTIDYRSLSYQYVSIQMIFGKKINIQKRHLAMVSVNEFVQWWLICFLFYVYMIWHLHLEVKIVALHLFKIFLFKECSKKKYKHFQE